jgi:hypothetical protein
MRWLVMVLAVVAAGCATPYQDMGFLGGVAAHQMTADTYRITARGNEYTRGTTIQDYTALKAAETTKAAGATHFLIISAADASRTSYNATHGYGHTSVSSSIRPGQDTYIRVLTVPSGLAPPPGAVSADEIIHFVGGRVQRG